MCHNFFNTLDCTGYIGIFWKKIGLALHLAERITVWILILIGRLWIWIRQNDADPTCFGITALVLLTVCRGVLPGMVHVRNLLPLVRQEAVPLARLNKESPVKNQPIGSHLASVPPIGFKNKTIQLDICPTNRIQHRSRQPEGIKLTSFRSKGFKVKYFWWEHIKLFHQ